MADENLYGEVEEVEQLVRQVVTRLSASEQAEQVQNQILTGIVDKQQALEKKIGILDGKLDKIIGIIQPPPADSIKVVIDRPIPQ